MNRVLDIAMFLDAHAWSNAQHCPLDADFSPRRYARLTRDNGDTAILMDADSDQKTPEFVSISAMLRQAGVQAPQIYAADPCQGLVLMEDFGNQNMGAMLDAGAEPAALYGDAASLLAHMHLTLNPAAIADAQLPHFNSQLLAAQAELFLDAYVPIILGRDVTETMRENFHAEWLAVLQPLDALPQSLMLRDFMPDNLMLLPDGVGGQKLGVLDFQDGGKGCIAYDLASLCEVVRRDGGDAQLDRVLDVYCAEVKPDPSREELKQACRILSVQRHTRILGILARQILKGRAEKRAYIERVLGFLRSACAEQKLQTISQLLGL